MTNSLGVVKAGFVAPTSYGDLLQLRHALSDSVQWYDCLIGGSPQFLVRTATPPLGRIMLRAMGSLIHGPTEAVGGVTTAAKEIGTATNTARLQNVRRLRLRAAVVTIDQLLNQLEVLNLQGRSRSLSAWHRRLYSLGRMPNATRLDLVSETSPRRVMYELRELQQRLIRDLADAGAESPLATGP